MVKYYSDFEKGEEFITPARTITEADVTIFSGLSGDYNPLHTNKEFAKETIFQERIVHGLLGISIATGLIFRTGIFDGSTIAFLGIEDWSFKKPIFIGDTIYVKLTIADIRKSSRPGRGILIRKVEVLNQKNEVIQSGILPLLVKDKE